MTHLLMCSLLDQRSDSGQLSVTVWNQDPLALKSVDLMLQRHAVGTVFRYENTESVVRDRRAGLFLFLIAPRALSTQHM